MLPSVNRVSNDAIHYNQIAVELHLVAVPKMGEIRGVLKDHETILGVHLAYSKRILLALPV